jgi:hypothetical protein
MCAPGFLERPGKTILGVVAQLKADFLDGEISVQQQALGAPANQSREVANVPTYEETSRASFSVAKPSFFACSKNKVLGTGQPVIHLRGSPP